MTKSAPQQPGVEEKAAPSRFRVVPSPSHGWSVVDVCRGDNPMALCPNDEDQAVRIALGLNTLGRLLVDEPEPYMVADVERIRDNLARLAVNTAAQAASAGSAYEPAVVEALSAEARFLDVAAEMVRRLMAELLKFRMIEERVPVMVDALRHSALTFRVNESATREKARRDGAELDDPALVAGIERAAEAWAQAAELCERALGIEGGGLVGAERAGDPPTPPQRHEAANRDRVEGAADAADIGRRLVELARTSSHAAAVLGIVRHGRG